MLHLFLNQYREEILSLAESKTQRLAGNLSSSQKLKEGLPIFYEHLIGFLKGANNPSAESKIVAGAAYHGKELLRLHYSLSHVVHSYGAMCQAITELAQRKKANITSQEFNDLNMCLDIAVASAVSEFQFRSVKANEDREVQHLGSLVHELRNALSSATVASEMIKQGLVGAGGSTARVLEDNLAQMCELIDRSLSDLRMRTDPVIRIEKFQLNTLVDQILLTTQNEARLKKLVLRNELKSQIEMQTDRQLLLSALANLIQNALKYSKKNGHINIRAGLSGEDVVIEVEDECGGIDIKKIKSIFKPFVSVGHDRSGLGLGLTIVQKAVFLLRGTISVRNSPGRGCAFLVTLPKKLIIFNPARTVSGNDSVQPKTKSKKVRKKSK